MSSFYERLKKGEVISCTAHDRILGGKNPCAIVEDLYKQIHELQEQLERKDYTIKCVIDSLLDINQAEWCSIGIYVPNSKCGGYFSGCIEDCSLCAEKYYEKLSERKLAEMRGDK